MRYLLLLNLLLLVSCSTYRKPFYTYTECHGSQCVSSKINQQEINKQTSELKDYLNEINLEDSYRILESFYKLTGNMVYSSNKTIKKDFRLKEHHSSLLPQYQTKLNSAPLITGKSSISRKGRIEANVAGVSLIKPKQSKGPAVDDISVLKYLYQLAWHPSAFLNKHLSCKAIQSDGISHDNGVLVSIDYRQFEGRGILAFNKDNKMPQTFTGYITYHIKNEYDTYAFKATYSDYREYDGYWIPYQSHLILEMDNNESVSINLKLKKIRYLTAKDILDKTKKKNKGIKLIFRKRKKAKDNTPEPEFTFRMS